MISPRYNYPAQFGTDVDRLVEDIRSMLLAGRYILTAEVRSFEQAFASYIGTAAARGVNSGTDALLLSLLALGVGPGDEVITQANAFHASVAAIHLAGATPVLVDACENSFLMDTVSAANAITPRTRVVIPVHLYGKPTPMLDLLATCSGAGVHLIEDAAQAHGASIHGRRIGSFGVASCFSFHPSKNLAAAGDAGAIVSDDSAFIEKIDQLRALGQRAQNDHVVVGYNSKLDAIQARVLACKLPHLDEWNCSRAEIAEQYRLRLEGLPVTFQSIDPGETHVFHLFQLRCQRRDELLCYLVDQGVDAVTRYPVPIHLQPAFARYQWQRGQFPVAEKLAEQLLCLPLRPDMTVTEIAFVTDTVRKFFDGC
ncbi:MAG: DegT/DnrJ/EryC1/StrS family aminotransferase [Janthinobacterium lividum]